MDRVSAELAEARTDSSLPGTNTPFATAKSLLIDGSLEPIARALGKMDAAVRPVVNLYNARTLIITVLSGVLHDPLCHD